MDLENSNMEKLKTVFPECFSEGKLDIDKLLSLCGEYIEDDFEKYKFEWKGQIRVFASCTEAFYGNTKTLP